MNSKFHPLTQIIISTVFIIITFGTENPILLFSILGFFIFLFICTRNSGFLKRDLLLFIPFFLVTVLINIVFSSEGSIVILNVLGRKITLESVIYAAIFSFKLLLIIMDFSFLSMFVDSDRALSYFSSKLSKSAFMLLISFKLFPNMKKSLQALKEIYTVRGVNIQSKKLKQRVTAVMPAFTIMLENSMETAFDLGEAAYVRGFFSGRRSCYERQRLSLRDYLMSAVSSCILILFAAFKYMGGDNFNIYESETYVLKSAFSIALSLSAAVMAIIFYISLKNTGEEK